MKVVSKVRHDSGLIADTKETEEMSRYSRAERDVNGVRSLMLKHCFRSRCLSRVSGDRTERSVTLDIPEMSRCPSPVRAERASGEPKLPWPVASRRRSAANLDSIDRSTSSEE